MDAHFRVPSVINHDDITGWDPASLSLFPLGENAGIPGPALLERVAELGSLRDAAAQLGLDEDLAWDYLVAANNLCDQPLIRPLAENLLPTRHARGLVGRGEEMAAAFQRFLAANRGGAFHQFQMRHQFLRRLEARTSARNQFYCKVKSVRRERVNAVVVLEMGGGDLLAAHITSASVEALGLVSGRACYALVDPAWVEVRPACSAARGAAGNNTMAGRVARCLADPVDTEVSIELAGGRIVVASMSHAEMAEKDMRVGRPAQVLIQSSQIVLAVEAAADSPE